MSVDGMRMYGEIDAKMHMLDAAVSELRSRGSALAQAERDYRVAKAKAILDEREKGTPATITADIVKGRPDIAKLCFERDCAEVVYRSALEAINALKLELRLIDSQVARDWGQASSMM